MWLVGTRKKAIRQKKALNGGDVKSVFIRRGDECIAISGPSPGHGH